MRTSGNSWQCWVIAAAASVVATACPKTSQTRAEGAAGDPMVLIAKNEQERAAPAAFAAQLASSDAEVRARAALGVARLEVLAAEGPLAAALGDADARVRANAAFGLGQIDLAVDPKAPTHPAVRAAAEKRLLDALATERDDTVRSALIRALGRVSDGPGLDKLIAMAAAPGPERATALTALGVSGARRQASRASDPGLVAAVAKGVGDSDIAVQSAAAYVAFRQKLRLPKEAVAAALASKEPQARIFITRAATAQDDAGTQLIIDAALKDADWRVQVEGLRATAGRAQSTDAVAATLADATNRLTGGQAPMAHVVREACTALAASGAGPQQVKPALQRALVTLAKTTDHRGEACACAVALDVVEPGGNAVERCDVDADDSRVDRLKVMVAARARTPSSEQVAALGRFLKSDDVKVRMAAADALVNNGSRAAAELAAEKLVDERDFGVAGTLIDGLFEDNADALPDSTLYKVVEHFKGGTSFEQVAPLVTVATLARARQTPTARAILAELSGHGEPRVRDAAKAVPAGERAPGPRAAVVAAPPAAQMPLYAVIKTTRGSIRIAFDRDHAPSSVANFVALARAHFYDGTPFHRVIGDFVAQGGDKRGDGAGGPGYTIACENSDEAYTRGAVGMATSGKDTGGSQFFFTHSWQPHLDGRYTLFARVVDGLDVVDALQPDDTLTSIDFNMAAPAR